MSLLALQGLVYDYYVDEATGNMVPWADRVPSFSYMPGSFATLFVPTVESTRLTYFLDQLISRRHYVMFVGNTGAALHPTGSIPSRLSERCCGAVKRAVEGCRHGWDA